jgi:g-D-glutamyl-meso-diaminopimelate peptidase
MKFYLLCILCAFTFSFSFGQGDTLRVDTTAAALSKQKLVEDSVDLRYYVVEDSIKYTFDMIMDDIAFFESNWPQYVKTSTIGLSEFGLPLKGFTISKNSNPKPLVFFVGNIHAREDFSSKMVMKTANIMLLSLSGKSTVYSNISTVLDSVDLFLLPVANPDGLKIAHNDLSGIKDQAYVWFDSIQIEETIYEWKANGKGIDLNSSFDDNFWTVKKAANYHATRASEGFKGSYPAEPKETQLLQAFIQKYKPICTLSFHTKGNILYWADNQTHFLFNEIDTKMSADAQKVSGFTLGKIGTKPSDFACGLENYVRSKSGSIGVCVELSCGGGGKKQHADSLFNTLVWEKAWQIPFSYLRNSARYSSELMLIQQQFYARREDLNKP